VGQEFDPPAGLRRGTLIASVAISSSLLGSAVALSGFGLLEPGLLRYSAIYMGLLGPPLSLLSAGLLLVPSLAMRADSARSPVLALLSAGFALASVGGAVVAGVGFVALFPPYDGSGFALLGGVAVMIVTPIIASGLALTEAFRLSRFDKDGGLSEHVSFGVVPVRGGGQAALSVRF
jgi:hypothetical protein